MQLSSLTISRRERKKNNSWKNYSVNVSVINSPISMKIRKYVYIFSQSSKKWTLQINHQILQQLVQNIKHRDIWMVKKKRRQKVSDKTQSLNVPYFNQGRQCHNGIFEICSWKRLDANNIRMRQRQRVVPWGTECMQQPMAIGCVLVKHGSMASEQVYKAKQQDVGIKYGQTCSSSGCWHRPTQQWCVQVGTHLGKCNMHK